MAKGKVSRDGGAQHEEFSVEGANLPPNSDYALVGDTSDGGQVDVDASEEEKNWDLPEGQTQRTNGTDQRVQQRDEGEQQGFDEEDARLAYSDDTEEGPRERQGNSKRQRRNQLRRERASRDQAEIQALRTQLEELGGVVRHLATGQGSLAVNTIEGQISSLENSLRIADDEMANAVAKSDGDTYSRALKIRDEIVGRLYGLRNQHARLSSSVMQQERADGGQVAPNGGGRQPAQQQQVDPRIIEMVEDRFDRFSERFPWFDAQGNDANSNIVRAIDRELAGQGYQRHTAAFWQNLERRMSDYGLRPVRGEGDGGDEEQQEQAVQQRGTMDRPLRRPPTSSGRSTQSRGGGFTLSEVQTSILRDEGLLEDKLSDADLAKRDRIIAKWKSANGAGRRQGARG